MIPTPDFASSVTPPQTDSALPTGRRFRSAFLSALGFGSKRRAARVRKGLSGEGLEDRVLLVIGATAFATPTVRGGDFDGVVQLVNGCTGSLLENGTHILSAAHCVDGPDAGGAPDFAPDVQFEMARDGLPINIPIGTTNVQSVATYNGDTRNGDDLTILQLTDPVNPAPNRRLIAPFGAQRYGIFSGNIVNQQYTIVGYGETGTGTTGQQSNEVQRLTVPAGAATFTLTYAGQTTGNIASNSSASDVAAALQTLPAIQNLNTDSATDILVSNRGLGARTWDIRFQEGGPAAIAFAGSDGSNGSTTQIFAASSGSGGTKRVGLNHFASVAGNVARSDFDSGAASEDALSDGLGNGANEGFGSRGDSGGPLFIRNGGNWEIAAAVSHTPTPTPAEDINDYRNAGNSSWRDNSFGEVNGDTHVQPHVASFVNPAVAGTHHLVLDMNQQALGQDLWTEDIEIDIRRNGANLEVEVTNVSSPGVFEGTHVVPFADVLSVTIRGGNDMETLHVDQSGGAINIPVTFDGGGLNDTLELDASGSDVVVTSTGVTVAGASPVTFSNVEQLDLGNAGQVEVRGDGLSNQFGVQRNGAPTMVRASFDGLLVDVSTPAVDLVFEGFGGDDSLTVDHSAGLVSGVVRFDAASGFDTLVMEGDPGTGVARETYVTGPTQDAGALVVDPNDSAGTGVSGPLDGDELIVNFTGLDPIDTSTPAVNFDVFLTGGEDNFRFEDGGFLGGDQSIRVVDVGGTFETFRYANKQNITVDALGGNDLLSSDDSTVAAGELSRTLVGNVGDDVFQLGEVNTTAVGGMGNDIYAFVTDSAPATVVIDEQLGGGNDTVTFATLASPAQSASQSGVSLATAGAVTVNVAASGQQQNIELGVNASPYLAYTTAPPTGVPFMTLDYQLDYADVGTVSSHTALFNWGDGNSEPATVTGALGLGVFNGSHQFDAVDTYNVLATITDNEGLATDAVASTDIMHYALLPDQKNPAFTALYVGGTVGPDILQFRQRDAATIRATLNSVNLGDFVFDGGVFAYTGSGNDVITPKTVITRDLTFEGGGDVDLLKGSVGNDMLFGQGGKDSIYGREGDDIIDGGDERDRIWGEDGHDTITGGEGNDVIRAGKGHDYVDGGAGNDKLKGDNGHDVLLGRGNNDTITGGNGNDVIFGGSGLDKLSGGKGDDLLLGDASTHDADPVAVLSIYDEWVDSASPIAGRVANIEAGGGLNGANTLASGVTIFDDGKADILVSGQGNDWYLVFSNDRAKGVSALDDLLSAL